MNAEDRNSGMVSPKINAPFSESFSLATSFGVVNRRPVSVADVYYMLSSTETPLP